MINQSNILNMTVIQSIESGDFFLLNGICDNKIHSRQQDQKHYCCYPNSLLLLRFVIDSCFNLHSLLFLFLAALLLYPLSLLLFSKSDFLFLFLFATDDSFLLSFLLKLDLIQPIFLQTQFDRFNSLPLFIFQSQVYSQFLSKPLKLLSNSLMSLKAGFMQCCISFFILSIKKELFFYWGVNGITHKFLQYCHNKISFVLLNSQYQAGIILIIFGQIFDSKLLYEKVKIVILGGYYCQIQVAPIKIYLLVEVKMLEQSFYYLFACLVADSPIDHCLSIFVFLPYVNFQLKQPIHQSNIIQSDCHFERKLSCFVRLLQIDSRTLSQNIEQIQVTILDRYMKQGLTTFRVDLIDINILRLENIFHFLELSLAGQFEKRVEFAHVES